MDLVDIFADDAFKVVSLTKSILALPFKPSRLGAMGLFKEEGIPTTTAVIESLDGTLTLLPTAPRGGPGSVAKSDKRKLRSFPVPHIPHVDAVLADAVQGVRQMGSSDVKQNAARVVTQRLSTMRGKHELTHEYHRATYSARNRCT